MDFAWLTGLITFACAMAATPGPNNTMVAASGATYGMARSLPVIAGITFGVTAIMLMVSAFGVSFVTYPAINVTLKWLGIAYLLWLAWKIATAEPTINNADATVKGIPLSFSHSALFQFINPKLWVMVAGAVATYGQAASGAGEITLAIIFAVIFGTMTFISVLVWTALGASVARFFRSPRAVRVFNNIMAGLLVISLVPVVFT
jgi:threonine/homoserine/homoserine lactone efflux protein